jgi:ABC-2 type transport system ATP-binding protein
MNYFTNPVEHNYDINFIFNGKNKKIVYFFFYFFFICTVNLNKIMSILISNVSKVYGTQYALNNVSFEVQKGEIVGFLGPNGAGKSTMMKIITCFIPPTEGDVSVCGFDIWNDSIEVRKRIGYLSESNPLYYDMYVREFLEFIAGVYHLKNVKQRVEEVIETTRLEIEQHKKIGSLSRGYRQRVGLAQALIHDPEVLILDEPTTGLDPNQLVEFRELIRQCGKKKTVLLSTHIMQEVEAMCNRVIIINRGSIVANNSMSELKEKVTSFKKSKKNSDLSMEEVFHYLTKG